MSSVAVSMHIAACEEKNGPTLKAPETRLSTRRMRAFTQSSTIGKKTKAPLRTYQGSPWPRRTSCASSWIAITTTRPTTNITRMLVSPLAENANRSIQGRWTIETNNRIQASMNNAFLRKQKELVILRTIFRFLKFASTTHRCRDSRASASDGASGPPRSVGPE